MTTVSLQTRQRIMETYDKGGCTRQEIADSYGVSLGMVKKLIQQRKNTGDLNPRHHLSGRKRKLSDEIRRDIKNWVEYEPWLHPYEIQQRLEDPPRNISCSEKTVCRALSEMGLRSKGRTS